MAFNLPIQNYIVPTADPDPWIRPSDWPVITDAPKEVHFLMSDVGTSSCQIELTFTRTSGSQNLVIDWGDGSTNIVTATLNSTVTHDYMPGSGTPCSRGYTTFVIRMYFTGTGVSALGKALIRSKSLPGNTLNAYIDCGLLEIYYGDNTITADLSNAYQSFNPGSTSTFAYLEYVKFPNVMSQGSFVDTFNNCVSLSVVVMPTSMPNISNFSNAFVATKLRSFTFPTDAINVINYQSCFSGCKKLKYVSFPSDMNKATTIGNMFFGCELLKTVTLPSINICNTMSSTFNSCTSLQWVKFTSLPTFATNTVVTATNMFSSCFLLENIYFPATCSDKAIYGFGSVFSSCSTLKNIVFPIGFSPSTLTNTFSSCSSLVSVIFQSDAPSLINLQQCFSSCFKLKKVILPNSVGSSITLFLAFSQCYVLEEVTIPSSYQINSLASTFQNCPSLKKINWNLGVQNLLTTLSSTFSNCSLLTDIILPTSMSLLNNLSGTFGGCRSITNIIFPSNLNAVTTAANLFVNCNSLESVQLPISMAACTTFQSAFQSCSTISTITLPQVVSSNCNIFQSAFTSCAGLKTVTFPSSQQLSLVNNLAGFIQGSGNLTTFNNFDKIGSLGSTPLVDAGSNQYAYIPNIEFSCPLSTLLLNNQNATRNNSVNRIRLLNTSSGQWTGASPQINVSYTSMSTANIIQLFNDIAAQGTVVSKTITITGATGVSGLTAADRLIVTSKGWTITG